MILPPLGRRREIDRNLSVFFHANRRSLFNRAISDLCSFYGVKRPRIEWYEYIDWGRVAGRTYEDGRIHLVHPENWKRGRKYYRERMWVQMIYHEMGHYLLWTDAERKANLFMRRMVTGLRLRTDRNTRGGSRRRVHTSRRIAARRNSEAGTARRQRRAARA
jgi:hypothetical protein